MSEIKTAQIVKPKRNNLRRRESEAKSKPNVLQMIKDFFNEMALHGSCSCSG
jgi:hypothetical protein